MQVAFFQAKYCACMPSDKLLADMQDERRMLHAVYRVGELLHTRSSQVISHAPPPCCMSRCMHAVTQCVALAGNLDETIKYYEKHFGLKQLRYRDIPEV